MKNQPSETLQIPLTEKLKSIPEIFGIRFNEEPEYDLLSEDGDFEVRRYSAQLMAHVTLQNVTFDEFREAAFKKLAHFIFGGNTKKTDVAMTSPVLQVEEAPKTWTMSFVLPAEYNLTSIPKPLDSSIRIEQVAGYDAAVMRYTGTNSYESMKAHEQKLMAWIGPQNQFEFFGPVYAAQYDAPFVIPFLRRNEVCVKVIPQRKH